MRIAIYGSTGSIGCNALSVLNQTPAEQYTLVALSGHSNTHKLASQASQWQPQYLIITQPYSEHKAQLFKDYRGTVLWGMQALTEFASSDEYDSLLLAITGSAALPSAYAVVTKGKRLLLANKEVLVAAGELITKAAQKHGSQLVPVDSEHNALWQCLGMPHLPGCLDKSVSRMEITASGGPFWKHSAKQIYNASVEQACNHPNWSMGNKISVDSANMVNKALEIIETCWLFNLPISRLGVVIHPQSLVHGLVHMQSGSTLAQLSLPDMRVALITAIFESNISNSGVTSLSLLKIRTLDFFALDNHRFASIPLVYQALADGKDRCLCFDISNEVANQAFRQGRIPFGAIVEVIAEVLQQTTPEALVSIDQVRERQQQLAKYTEEVILARR